MSSDLLKASQLVELCKRRRKKAVAKFQELVKTQPPAAQARLLSQWLREAGIEATPQRKRRGPRPSAEIELARAYHLNFELSAPDRRMTLEEFAEFHGGRSIQHVQAVWAKHSAQVIAEFAQPLAAAITARLDRKQRRPK